MSTDTEKTSAPTQTAPAPSEPTVPGTDKPVQEDPGFRWWVIALIAGIVLLGGGLTGMILFRGGKTVFKKD